MKKKLLFLISEILVICAMGNRVYAGQELLTDPYLQHPTDDSVLVEWYTEYKGEDNCVELFENGTDNEPSRIIKASTVKLSRIRGGKNNKNFDDSSVKADIYKHKAVIDNLPEYHGKEAERVLYRVISDGAVSDIYSLSAIPQPGTELKILLTSDLQMKDMCAANFEMVEKEIGRIDAVFVNGDCVDVTDRAYDWFYSDNSFFRVLQGKANHKTGNRRYKGGSIIQSAPVYVSVGNHDVMGIYDEEVPISFQFNSPKPRFYAEEKYEQLTDKDSVDKEKFIKDNSFNTDTYEEIFDLPLNNKGKELYYTLSIGDVDMIVLDTSRVWRQPMLGITGKYTESPDAPKEFYGYGDFIFEDISEGSDQLTFLKREIKKQSYKDAKYKLVMFHFQYHSLGGNQIPPYTDPVASEVTDPVSGKKMVTYDYPKSEDYIDKYVAPLLEEGGVDLLFTGHSHVWDRFKTESGMNILESSNIGNTYNCFMEPDIRSDYPSAIDKDDPRHAIADNWDKENYVLSGDPYGLKPESPNIKKLPDNKPYLASNTITAFSVLDTGKGTVDSYYFDTENPDKGVVLFDSFNIKRENSGKLSH